jgi:hypothetical protein
MECLVGLICDPFVVIFTDNKKGMIFSIQQGRLECNSCMYTVFGQFEGGCFEVKHKNY